MPAEIFARKMVSAGWQMDAMWMPSEEMNRIFLLPMYDWGDEIVRLCTATAVEASHVHKLQGSQGTCIACRVHGIVWVRCMSCLDRL